MKTYPGAMLLVVVGSVWLSGCQMQREKPTDAQIEVVGMKAIQELSLIHISEPTRPY